ncbi:MAG: hypothetical protein Q6J44_08805 [Gloeomargarita sp. DG02_4_bins_56]
MSFPNTDWSSPACRCCRHYSPEGRRGGHCALLGVEVQGDWSMCYFAVPPFAPSWERLEGLGMPMEPGGMLGTVVVSPHWQTGLESAVGMRA